MDTLAARIDSKTYPLNKGDVAISSVHTRFVFFYKNQDSSGTFMPSEKLKEGFFRTLAKFPWLLGFLKRTSSGLLEVVVDKDNLNVPTYRETQSDVHFGDIKSAKYSPEAWPAGVIPVGRLVCPDKNTKEIKLANFHVVRFKDNSGLVISTNFCHGVADGASYCMFFNHWADETRALVTGEPLEEVEYCFDSRLIFSYLPKERTPLNELTEKAYSIKSRVGDWLMSLSPNTRGKLLNFLENESTTCGHHFRIPHKKLDDLRTKVLECIPPGTHISENDILVALMYKVQGQAGIEAIRRNRGWFSWLSNRQVEVTGEHCCFIAYDLCHRLGMSNINYFGNPLFNEFLINPMDHAQGQITPQSIADIAVQVRSMTARMTPPYIAQALDMIESPDRGLGGFPAIKAHFKNVAILTGMKQVPLYDADFGSGVQAFSTSSLVSEEGLICFLPSPPPSKDTIVAISISPAVMSCILENGFWVEIAELVY